MSGARHWEQDKEATVYIGNLDERVSDSLVWELMLQAGRIVNVHLPKDRVTQTHQGYGFVEFISEEDAEYAARIMNQVRLYGKPIRVNKASADKQKTVEVGAELFIGNLDSMVTEQTLYDTFSRFGSLISAPKARRQKNIYAELANSLQVARDDANLSKGYGFVSFSSFDASDEAIANLNGQYLMNKEISVQYAYKKDGKGERHGDQAERTLAAQARKHNVQPASQPLPAGLFTGGAPNAPAAMNDLSMSGMMTPQTPAIFMPGRPGPMNGAYQSVLPPQQHRPTPPPQPLAAPPSGLPARPPPSQAGYGGPQGFLPPGFTASQPPGFAASTGAPPGLPPGFQPVPFVRNR
ncbi:hypothetical protein MMC11_008368 [Xylographa trunciseda]|nr:hypothetical protein [Xylographa trunciseda]